MFLESLTHREQVPAHIPRYQQLPLSNIPSSSTVEHPLGPAVIPENQPLQPPPAQQSQLALQHTQSLNQQYAQQATPAQTDKTPQVNITCRRSPSPGSSSKPRKRALAETPRDDAGGAKVRLAYPDEVKEQMEKMAEMITMMGKRLNEADKRAAAAERRAQEAEERQARMVLEAEGRSQALMLTIQVSEALS